MAASGGHWASGKFQPAGGMSMKQRMDHRRAADKLVKLAEKRGISDSMRISSGAPSWLTVGHLREYIEPQYREAINSAIRGLERS